MKLANLNKAEVTLYYPGDGSKDADGNSNNKAIYKDVTEFQTNVDGTVTFKSVKHGTIHASAGWRIKETPAAEGPAKAGQQKRAW